MSKFGTDLDDKEKQARNVFDKSSNKSLVRKILKRGLLNLSSKNIEFVHSFNHFAMKYVHNFANQPKSYCSYVLANLYPVFIIIFMCIVLAK